MTRKRKQAGRHYHGLKNQGATCYLNSVLQVLYMTKDFREAVTHSSQHNPGCIDHHLSSVFNALTKQTASTQGITNHLGITKVNEQHDAAECFDKILSCSSSKASQIFKGELTHKNTCSKCERETESNSPFWSLPLTLSEMEYYCVTDGIQKYFQESKLCGENQLYCHECKDKTDSSTKLEMHHHPDVLTLLLKRFKFDYHCMDYVKIKCTVKIQDTLEIPTTEHKSLIYQLYAYVEHSGELRSGHYTVTIKPQDGDKWFTFNDNMVTLIQSHFQPFQVDKEETSSSAYLLFYRKTTDPSDADRRGASTSGCSKSNEPCRKDVETTQREEGEKEAARTGCNEGGQKTHKKAEIKTGMIVRNEQSKMTGRDTDSLMLMSNKCTEQKNMGGKQAANDRRKRKAVVHNQHKECKDLKRKQDASDSLSKNCPTEIRNQQAKTNDEEESKIENSDRLRETISTLSHERSEGKKEDPNISKCCQTRDKSERLIGEIEGNQKTVQQDNGSQNQLQVDIQQTNNTVTQKGAIKIDPNRQNDTKANDGETLSRCILMKNQKDLLDQQIQTNEKCFTESENTENVNESKSLAESHTEKMTEMQLKSGNGSGKSECTEHKKTTEINIDGNINCKNNRRLGVDGQSGDKLQDGSEKPNDLKQNSESVQNETKTGKNQVADDRRSLGVVDNQHKKECEDLGVQQDVSDTLSENCPRGLCYEQSETKRKDQIEDEERKGIRKPEGHCSETGEKNQILCSADVDENGLNQNVLQKEQHTNHDKHSEGHDSAGIDDLKLNHLMENHHSSAETCKCVSKESFKYEETIKFLPEQKQSKTYDEKENRIENSDRLKQNISASLHEEQEGTKDNPQNDICFLTREKSERLIGESEGNQNNFQQDKDNQIQLQGDIQQKNYTVTQKKAIKIDPNSQNDTKANDGEMLSRCILMQNHKDLLEQQIQSDETNSTGSESKRLAESNTRKMTHISPENQLEGGNGSGTNEKQNKKRRNQKHTMVVSRGLVCPLK